MLRDRILASLLAGLVLAGPAVAQYPTRPIKLVPHSAPGTLVHVPYKAGGFEPWNIRPEEFSAAIRRDYEKYGKLAKDIGVRVD